MVNACAVRAATYDRFSFFFKRENKRVICCMDHEAYEEMRRKSQYLDPRWRTKQEQELAELAWMAGGGVRGRILPNGMIYGERLKDDGSMVTVWIRKPAETNRRPSDN